MTNIEIFSTNDDYWYDLRIKEIANKLKLDKEDVSFLDLDAISLNEVITRCMTLDIFSSTRVIGLRSLDKLLKQKDKVYENFINYCKNYNSSCYLIIHNSNINSIAEAKKTLNYYASFETSEDVNLKLKDYEELCKKEAYKIASEFGLDISNEGIDILLRNTNLSLYRIKNELYKIQTYIYPRTNVLIEDVNILVSDNHIDTVFELIDAYLLNNKKKTFDIYTTLSNVMDIRSIISVFSQSIIKYQIVKLLRDKGEQQDSIIRDYGFSSGNLYYISKNIQNISHSKLANSIEHLASLDSRLKMNSGDPKTEFEIFLLR
jgi:DNA polymerase III delta subunit